jgi:O-antigen/teichoic acid export membrane protein
VPLFTFLGYALLVVCLSFMGYALAVFYNRTLKIVSGDRVRFDDNKGPVVLAVVMIIAFVFTGVAQVGFTM